MCACICVLKSQCIPGGSGAVGVGGSKSMFCEPLLQPWPWSDVGDEKAGTSRAQHQKSKHM